MVLIIMVALLTNPTFQLITGYCDPQDEKYSDMYGWYTSNRKCAGNAITVPAEKRVEGA